MKVIPKPIDSTWTDEQWQAITARGKDILVAAAAGSGKTAVLVERIIKRITDPDEPVDVDRLLIVTFTNAAAAEMKKRIGEALEQELSNNPGSFYLKKQLALLNKASISTLHSFCLAVLRRYYYKLDLDPKFRIADETEAILLREEILEELFEEQYSREDNELFFRLVDSFSSDRSDRDLQALVLKLYDFSRSHPEPDTWLEQMARRYGAIETQEHDVDPTIWTRELLEDISLQVQGGLVLLKKALHLTDEPGGPAPYAENIRQLIECANSLLHACEASWDAVYDSFQVLEFGKLKACRGDAYDPVLIERVKAIREQVKKLFSSIKGDLFSRPLEEYLQDIRYMAPLMHILVEVVKEFGKRYAQLKREKALVDFADLEHLCLEILRDEEVSMTFRQQYSEVLVDEYQDTNFVQESIIQLVTKEAPEPGNLFMVGDVKQSIYRFRLAEPGLFLSKYKQFAKQDSRGFRIDLARNFRSRTEVLDGTNYIFKQIMNEKIGEIEYDEDAELVPGAQYPASDRMKVDLILIERSEDQNQQEAEGAVYGAGPSKSASFPQEESDEYMDEQAESPEQIDQVDLETVQLEAKLMAKKIKELIGQHGQPSFQVYDSKQQLLRPIQYRDIVILLRATATWAPAIIEEFKKQGIPAYAELSSGYFSAIEVVVMISLLKIIDNPYQDIPLAAVLRSPIVGLVEEELAQIRILQKQSSFYDAVKAYISYGSSNQDDLAPAEQEDMATAHEITVNSELVAKLQAFTQQLEKWRTRARQGTLSELIWELYRETGYYDFIGGIPGGNQRQANLRALYDRARQYEATSFRGLFRFLRFIERMQDLGRDLGTARSLGEQEDVVRLMTIHKSKGLEFPVVFIAGLAKQFNLQDLHQRFLIHKELGFGTKLVDPEKRISYPMLPQLTIRRRMHMELLAEEMRVLYVALTRAKEKLFLIGTIKDKEKLLERWLSHLSHTKWILDDHERVKAKCYLDWIGPAVVRHQDARVLWEAGDGHVLHQDEIYTHPSKWSIAFIHSSSLVEGEMSEPQEVESIVEAIKQGKKVPMMSDQMERVHEILSWKYPYPLAQEHKAKQTVTELKRHKEWFGEDGFPMLKPIQSKPIVDRPRFLQEKRLTAAERGTAMHMVMQHLPLQQVLSQEDIATFLTKMVHNELLTVEQAQAIHVESILLFVHSELGRLVREGTRLHRELPFSYGLAAHEAFVEWSQNESEHEQVLVQGVIDCLIENRDGLVLIDYKTDQVQGRYRNVDEINKVMSERYSLQLSLYAKAIEEIWKQPVKDKYLFLFDGGHILKL